MNARLARLVAPPAAAALAVAALLAPAEARAFCGFYVGGSESKLVNNATEVVLMREGTRTVLSMQNNYQGPPEDFAMVVPVPVVLQKDNVRTLKKDLFDKVEQLSAPRLVEYWEQDPCPPPVMEAFGAGGFGLSGVGVGGGGRGEGIGLGAVRVEAKFGVGEYEIVILSADDALSLDTWLRQNAYKIPEGAEPILKPYVQGGMKFFVAKVDPKKVHFARGMAELSPLRFHYDSELFSLPVRLGLLNSNGTQDLIVHVLSRGQRYEVANYPNVAIPTNLDVLNRVRGGFASFYASLFDATVRKHKGAVVTEYAWSSDSCDPCPSPPLSGDDIARLGGDVAGPPRADEAKTLARPGRGGWVLTRLHARYAKEALGEDLVFKEAPPIVGGREFVQDNGRLETTAKEAQVNNFQARYAIRHLWSGPIKCANPQRGIWGGPPGGEETLHAATGLAFARRNVPVSGNVTRGSIDAFVLSLPSKVPSTIPLGIVPSPLSSALAPASPPEASLPEAEAEADERSPLPAEPPAPPPPVAPPRGGCAGCLVGGRGGESESLAALGFLGLLGALVARARRRWIRGISRGE